MNAIRTHWLSVAVLALAPVASRAQQSELALDLVLEHPERLLPPEPVLRWVPGGHRLALEDVVPDPRSGETVAAVLIGPAESIGFELAFDARQVRAALGIPVAGEGEADAPRLPAWSWLDASTLRFVHDGDVYHWRPGDERAALVFDLPQEAAERQFGGDRAFAPGDAHAAVVLGHDLFVFEPGGARRRITWDGSPDIAYGTAAHRAEFGITEGMWWGPQGRFLAFSREDLRPVAPYPYQDPLAQPPVALHGRYPMAGDADSVVTIGIYDAADASVRYLEHDDRDLYWTNVTFGPGGDKVFVVLVNRGQDRAWLARFDCATGKREATLLVEQDPQWVEPEHGPVFLPDGRFLWLSSRDGWRRAYLYDADGTLRGPVSQGDFDVQEVLGFDPAHRGAYFMASGEDPRQRHLFFATLDGGEQRRITGERGTHRCELSPDRRYVLDRWSHLELPGAVALRDLDSGAETRLPDLPDPLAAFRTGSQRFFEVKADDGTLLHGHLILPPDLDESKRHPALLYVYGGPHAQLVQDRWLGGASLWLHWMATRGYVVCRLDNRGTPNRGIDFEQAIHRRLGVLEVRDQLAAVDYLKSLPFVEPRRIGVHGWSYGGYMTLRLLLSAPETFACGVSGAPVTDWRQYETGYTERYMDTPLENPDGYRESSCLPLAGRLAVPLLLVQGTDDRTVMWSHTLRFVDRCIDEGVTTLRYLPYPMQKHGLRGRDRVHFHRLMTDFFAEHLHPGK